MLWFVIGAICALIYQVARLRWEIKDLKKTLTKLKYLTRFGDYL